MGKGPKILIIDHDALFFEQVVSQLKRHMMTISWLVNGKHTLNRIAYLMPDVVIINVNMPGVDPVRVLEKIKRRYPLVEVILIADQTHINEAILGMQRGAADYLKKPVNLFELIMKIKIAYRKILDQHEKISRFERFLIKEK